ncbi:MAG: hypothetical protein O2894_13610, partial [Planctomycetota bacterium]|nr:hypothetical protein [Planctomycetota bacterium]
MQRWAAQRSPVSRKGVLVRKVGKADRHIDGTDSAGTFLPDHYADLVAHLRARTFTKAPEVVAWVLQRLADDLTPFRILEEDQSPAKETVYKIERARTSGQLDAFERYLDTRDIEPIRAANRAAHRAASRRGTEARRPSEHEVDLHIEALTDLAAALAGDLAVVRPLSAAETSPRATVEGALVVSFWAHLGSDRHERYLTATAALRSYHEQCATARDITIDRARSALPWLEGDNLAAFVNATFTRAVDRAEGRPPVPPSPAGVELVTGAAAEPVLRMGSG